LDNIRFQFVRNAREKAKLPCRADKGSAGYDFCVCEDIVLNPGDVKLVFTDVKAYMPEDIVLLITIRSSLAKKGIILPNSPGVVDSSYVDNKDNEGNIGIILANIGKNVVKLRKGDRVAQGIFVKYFTTENDAIINLERAGGFGSSGVA